MITWTLSLLFPPKLGKIEDVDSSVLLYKIAHGEVDIVDPGPLEAGVIATREWSNRAWRLVEQTKVMPYIKHHLYGERKEQSQEITRQLQPSHSRVGGGSIIPESRLLWVRAAQ